MTQYKALLILFLCGLCSTAYAQSCGEVDRQKYESERRNSTLENQLHGLFQCMDGLSDAETQQNSRSACNWFTGKAVEEIWEKSDFRTPDGQRFLTTSAIAALGSEGLAARGWKSLGKANNQQSLNAAEEQAFLGKPVIAVKPGHVAIVLPGGLADSPSWGVKVPLAAQLSLDNIDKAFVGCMMSRSWSANDAGSVELFFRTSVVDRLLEP